MEQNSYPRFFGDKVREIRKDFGMNQVDFYNYLFPNNNKQEETIKKKMNSIENGKQKSVDIDFFRTLCTKCDISADYLFGYDEYENKSIKDICEYTGLSTIAIKQLHEWQNNANNGADISILGHVYVGDSEEDPFDKPLKKLYSLQYLKILNYIFTEAETTEHVGGKKRTERYSNVGVLHSLYMLCITRPYRILGEPLLTETFGDDYEWLMSCNPFLRNSLERVSLDASKTMILQDDNDVWYSFDVNKIFEQIARNHLDKSIERLVNSIRGDMANATHPAVHTKESIE